MIDLRFDMSAFEQAARDLNAAADQLPYALARSLNDAAFAARKEFIDSTWPSHVSVRNAAFMNAAWRVDKATKTDLSVAVYDRLGRANLKLHQDAGAKSIGGKVMAIPAKGTVTLGPRGVPKSQRARAIIAKTPKRALRITPRGIFVGKNGGLQLRFLKRASVFQKADVPFRQDFERVMRREMERAFPEWLKTAMRSRRTR